MTRQDTANPYGILSCPVRKKRENDREYTYDCSKQMFGANLWLYDSGILHWRFCAIDMSAERDVPPYATLCTQDLHKSCHLSPSGNNALVDDEESGEAAPDCRGRRINVDSFIVRLVPLALVRLNHLSLCWGSTRKFSSHR